DALPIWTRLRGDEGGQGLLVDLPLERFAEPLVWVETRGLPGLSREVNVAHDEGLGIVVRVDGPHHDVVGTFGTDLAGRRVVDVESLDLGDELGLPRLSSLAVGLPDDRERAAAA